MILRRIRKQNQTLRRLYAREDTVRLRLRLRTDRVARLLEVTRDRVPVSLRLRVL